MNYEFKGTQGPWLYEKPTKRFDACTVLESGEIIGYCAKNSKEDRYNELLRSKVLEMFERLKKVLTNMDNGTQTYIEIEQLLKEATEL